MNFFAFLTSTWPWFAMKKESRATAAITATTIYLGRCGDEGCFWGWWWRRQQRWWCAPSHPHPHTRVRACTTSTIQVCVVEPQFSYTKRTPAHPEVRIGFSLVAATVRSHSLPRSPTRLAHSMAYSHPSAHTVRMHVCTRSAQVLIATTEGEILAISMRSNTVVAQYGVMLRMQISPDGNLIAMFSRSGVRPACLPAC